MQSLDQENANPRCDSATPVASHKTVRDAAHLTLSEMVTNSCPSLPKSVTQFVSENYMIQQRETFVITMLLAMKSTE